MGANTSTFAILSIIFLGGGLGSVLRYLGGILGNKIMVTSSFPLGTFLVNIIGCLLIGYFVELFTREGASLLRYFFIVGFCGGFTTFSTFSLENVQLWQEGNYVQFILYAFLSVALGFLAVLLGLYIGKIK